MPANHPHPARDRIAGGETTGSINPPARLAEAGENTVASRHGRRLAVEPLPPGAIRSRAGGYSAGEIDRGGLHDVAVEDLPKGTRLAVPLRGSSQALDATEPLVDENVYYDLPQGAYFAPDARLAYADRGGVQNEAGTIAFWLKPSWNGDEVADHSFIQLRTNTWDNRMHVFKNGVYLRFLIADDNGIEHNVGASVAKWKAGQWYHVAVTWGDGQTEEPAESVTVLYVNGNAVERNTHQGQINIPQGTPLYVGSDRIGGAPGADAVIEDLWVMDYAMTPEELSELYFTTRPTG